MNNFIRSRTKAWYEDREVVYSFPDTWAIQIFSPKPQKAIDERQIYKSIQTPIGCAPLFSDLKPHMKVCLLSDDISRPTRTDLIIPSLLQILRESGIQDESIQIVIASGAHPVMSDQEKLLKFGQKVCDRVQIVDHNYERHLQYRGQTSLGTAIYVNEYVAKSDFVIGVGGVYAAQKAGFSGGAKLILGACGSDTIRHFHSLRRGVERGGSIENEFRKDLLEAARLCGLRFIVNNLLSQDREVTDIFAGDPQEAFRAGVEKARRIYAAPDPDKLLLDMVVADAYPFDASCIFTRKGWWPVKQCQADCHRLLLSAIPKGVGDHGLFPFVPHRWRKLIDWFRRQRLCEVTPRRLRRDRKSTRLMKPKATVKKDNTRKTFTLPLVFFHSLDTNPHLPDPNIQFINDLVHYFQSLEATLNKQEFKVGFYRASSLLYPS